MPDASVRERFDQVLAVPLGAIRATRAHPAPPLLGRVAAITGLRVILALDGRKREVFGTGDAIEDWTMQPGDLLVVRPETWLIPDFTMAHAHLGVIFDDALVRVAWVRCPGQGDLRHTEATIDLDVPPRSPIRQVGDAVSAIDIHRDPGSARHLISALLHLLRSATIDAPVERSKAQRTWRQALGYIIEHADRQVTRSETAANLGISENYLTRLCTQRGGQSFIDLLTQIRLQRAQTMLRAVDLPIALVATACGFADAGYFIRRFRASFGQSPGAYRRSQRSGSP